MVVSETRTIMTSIEVLYSIVAIDKRAIFFEYSLLSGLTFLDIIRSVGYTSIITIIVVSFLSFLGAVVPAYRASKMLPIEAMKYNA